MDRSSKLVDTLFGLVVFLCRLGQTVDAVDWIVVSTLSLKLGLKTGCKPCPPASTRASARVSPRPRAPPVTMKTRSSSCVIVSRRHNDLTFASWKIHLKLAETMCRSRLLCGWQPLSDRRYIPHILVRESILGRREKRLHWSSDSLNPSLVRCRAGEVPFRSASHAYTRPR